MRPGWEKVESGVMRWYRREVEVGALPLRIDLWPLSDREWAFTFHYGPSQRIPASTLAKAMEAAECLVAGHLRSAARALRNHAR